MIELAIILGIAVPVVYYTLLRPKNPLDDIPGPKPYPIIGNVHQLDMKKMFVGITELAKRYGGIYKIHFFMNRTIVVSDHRLIEEVLIKQSAIFAGRPYFYSGKILSDHLMGISLSDAGPVHRARRKVLHGYLKQFGSGIQTIEEVTQTGTDQLLARLSAQQGRAVDVRDYIFEAVMDVIIIMLMADTISSEERTLLKAALDKAFTTPSSPLSGVILDIFPFVRFFGNRRYKEFQDVIKTKNKILSQWFDRKPSDGFMHFLMSLPETDKKHSFLDSYESQSKVVFEFLGAGTYTTSTTLTCLMNVLCHYPAVQEKLQKEIMEVVGASRPPAWKDRDAMPYLRAALHEISRFASVAPIGIRHKALQDCVLGGYKIPKDTQIFCNLWAMHHDEKLWDEPFTFKPERFLDSDGELVPADHPNRKNLLPFGAGQRVCVGEVFAVSRMFLITARILQNFTILPESSREKQPSCDPREMRMGMALKPLPFKVRMIAIS